MSQEFVGSGWCYPARTDAAGRVSLVSGDQEIVEAIALILGTAYGERPMRPEFGCGIHDHVFAPVDATTFGLLAHEVQMSLQRWEPRIDVLDIAVTADDSDPATVYIGIAYSIKGANDPRNLVFPFYTIPEH